MMTKCPHCEHQFDARPRGARLAAMLGSIAGATASRRLGGALVGGLVGYAFGHLIEIGSLARCPCCKGAVDASGSETPTPDPETST